MWHGGVVGLVEPSCRFAELIGPPVVRREGVAMETCGMKVAELAGRLLDRWWQRHTIRPAEGKGIGFPNIDLGWEAARDSGVGSFMMAG